MLCTNLWTLIICFCSIWIVYWNICLSSLMGILINYRVVFNFNYLYSPKDKDRHIFLDKKCSKKNLQSFGVNPPLIKNFYSLKKKQPKTAFFAKKRSGSLLPRVFSAKAMKCVPFTRNGLEIVPLAYERSNCRVCSQNIF